VGFVVDKVPVVQTTASHGQLKLLAPLQRQWRKLKSLASYINSLG
jgi:hypothetical protein